MITVQRVRVRWSAAARGAPHANLRRGLNEPMALPASLPTCDLAVHDVLYDEAAGYVRHEEVRAGDKDEARGAGLWVTIAGPTTIVDRLPTGAAFPRDRGKARLFALATGQVGRYRANFRFTVTRCACDPSWLYEDWVVHIGNGLLEPEAFVHREPDRDVDDRAHLYGG